MTSYDFAQHFSSDSFTNITNIKFSRTFYQQGKDGEMHPDVFSPDYDKVALWDLEAACLYLGLSYYISGDPKYAEKAVSLIDHWFLDPNSYMSPCVCHLLLFILSFLFTR